MKRHLPSLSVLALVAGVAAAALSVQIASAQDNEAMRKQLRQLGVPEAEIDRTLKGLDAKLKESGASDIERTAIMSQRKRGVKVHMRWAMDVKPFETEIEYACVKKPPHPPRFNCRYRISGETTVPADLHYLPLPETERILRSPKQDQERATAVLGIQKKISAASLLTRPSVSVEGECPAPGKTVYPCGVRAISNLYAENREKGDILGAVRPGPKGVRISFTGSLFDGKIEGKALAERKPSLADLKKDPASLLKPRDTVDAAASIAELQLVVNSETADEDYLVFFKQLFQTGHFRKQYRWPEIGHMGGDMGDGQVELTLDVELDGGPAPAELQSPKR